MVLKFGVIEQVVFLPATPEEVYDALLEPKKHAEFTGSPASTNSKVGVEFSAWDGYISGKNLELVKNKRIVQEWETTEWPPGYPRSRLELTMIAKKGGTELRMVHSSVPAEQVAKYTEGWKESYWTPLEVYLSRSKRGQGGNKPKARSKRASRSSA